MSTPKLLVCFVFPACFASLAAQPAAAPKWTAGNGTAVSGDFLMADTDALVIFRNGTEMVVPFEKLSPESVAQAKAMAEAATKALNPPNLAAPDSSFPKEKSWLKGEKTHPTKQGIDRVFLIDRGWKAGKLLGIIENDVVFEAEGKAFRIPRKEVSVIESNAWLDPMKRRDTREVKVRMEITGAAVNGEINFERGTIVKKVDAEPAYTVGKDDDDKAKVLPNGFWFDKQGTDNSNTTLVTDLTLLVPTNTLVCDLLCHRSNYDTGSYTVRFLNPADGSEMVTMRQPTSWMWTRLEVPVAKLQPGTRGFRPPVITLDDFNVRNVPLLPFTEKTGALGGPPKSRIVLFDDTSFSGIIVGMDDHALKVLRGTSQKPVAVPRWKIALIELNDWQTDWVEKTPETADTTQPITVCFAGPSTSSGITLAGDDTITTLIAPPHYLVGRDRDDEAGVNNERSFNIYKTTIDRSHTQAEMTAVFTVKSPVTVTLKVTNAFVNWWAGDLSVNFWRTLDQKKVASSGTDTQKKLASEMVIPRDQFFPR